MSYRNAILMAVDMVLAGNAFPILLGISGGKISMLRMLRVVTTAFFLGVLQLLPMMDSFVCVCGKIATREYTHHPPPRLSTGFDYF